MKHKIETVADILALWPGKTGVRVLCHHFGVHRQNVERWCINNSIPARSHAGVLRAAHKHGFKLTPDDLVRIHDNGKDLPREKA